MPVRKPLEIFVSYSHHDTPWRQHLFDDYVGTTFGDCRIWTDAQLRAGDRWSEEIGRRLDSSAVAVLLVSARFLKSDFINTRELPHILARARSAGLRIVWIPIAIDRETLAARPELAEIQGATGFDDVLPDQPHGCSSATLARVRQHIRAQLLSAVDPVGAELAALVARRYEVEHWLGEGNVAAIYKARDRVLQRAVAIKVLKDKDHRQAFMDDVRDAIRTSEEPNFVNVYDAAGEESIAYCVTQHIGGQTLQDCIAAHPRGLPVQTFRRLLLRITAAIVRAHALGVSYGNLKPSNIILDADGEPFILPMGRRRDAVRDEQKLQALLDRLAAAAAAGQPPARADQEDLAYLVPDHFGDPFEPVDPRLADQYMLGVLAWEMATGGSPVTVPHPERLREAGRAAFRELPPIGSVRPLCPQRIQDLLARMAARLPSRRFPDLAAVLQEADLLADLGLVIARDSYRRCTAAPDFDSAFFPRFYAEFLRLCPAAQPYFARFGADDWARQHRMLKEAVLLLFAFRQQNDGQAEPNVLSRIADSHGRIPAALYAPFLDALVHTVCGDEASGLPPADPQCADPVNRDKLEEYWRGALEPGIRYLQQRAAR